MKTILFITALFIFFALPLAALDVTVVSVSGSVEIKPPGGAWAPAEIDQIVSSQAMISTGFNSRAVLRLGESDLFVQALTRLAIDEVEQTGEVTRSSLSLQSGRVRAQVRSTRGRVDFRVSTPVATAAVRGTEFVLSPEKLEVKDGVVQFLAGMGFQYIPGDSFSFIGEDGRASDAAVSAWKRYTVNVLAGDIGLENGTGPGKSAGRSAGFTTIDLQ